MLTARDGPSISLISKPVAANATASETSPGAIPKSLMSAHEPIHQSVSVATAT
jgi:hypothetical protein